MRFLPVGPRTLLVELADLDHALALFDALIGDPVAGVAEIVPAACSLMIRTAPGISADGVLAGQIQLRAAGPAPDRRISDQIIEVPTIYDGADLDGIAAHLGISTDQVIAVHQAATWQVAFCGFAPGFAYMTCDDPRFDLPRRATPRTRIPAGSVALAGRFCGIYPQETPGGWQLIGRTPVPMWDLDRDPPALLRPGLRVRFVRDQGWACSSVALPRPSSPKHVAPATDVGLELLSSVFPVLFQDDGRPGQGLQGIVRSGALDRGALHRANRALGNPPGAPALELTLGPVRFRAGCALTLALTGAAEGALIERDGRNVAITPGLGFAVDAGDMLVVPAPSHGMRSYLALRGGFRVPLVLGSAATDMLAALGPSAVVPGTVLAPAMRPAGAVLALPEPSHDLPAAGDQVVLPVTLGPRTDWFSDETVQRFLGQDWLVTPESSRVGIRLRGERPLIRDSAGELPSEGTETGAIQIPHSGQPVLFMADHPLTGGYPVIATLMPQALALAGQIPPGARIRFTAAEPFAPIIPARQS